MGVGRCVGLLEKMGKHQTRCTVGSGEDTPPPAVWVFGLVGRGVGVFSLVAVIVGACGFVRVGVVRVVVENCTVDASILFSVAVFPAAVLLNVSW